jgi:predicted dehydrogenase
MKNIAVIGCGRWGPNHIRNFQTLPGARALYAVDPDAARLARIREAFPDVRLESDLSKVLADPAVDAVVVATPTSTHHAVVRDAIRAGKHVLCEKPLCENSAKAQELTELAQAKGTLLMVGHVFLFNDAIAKVKELVDGGEVGSVRSLAAVRTNLGPVRSDVNAAADLASHDISVFNWLLGSAPDAVSAAGGSFLQPGVEDVVSLSLRYPNNVFATILVSWLSPKKVRQMTIVGTKRMVTWDDLDLATPIAVYDAGAEATTGPSDYGEFLRVSTWDGDVRLPKVAFQEPLKAQAKAFLQALVDGKVTRSDGQFSLGVVRTLDAASKSLSGNGAFVRVEA